MDLDAVFSALSDPTRRAILARLAEGEASVTELGAPFALSQPAISKHLRVLEKAGLVQKGRDGQRRPCRLEVEPLVAANQWLERYRDLWERNYRRLDDLLATLREEDAKREDEPEKKTQKSKKER
jgi:DNA-binding transcriptional ArsR family regulator